MSIYTGNYPTFIGCAHQIQNRGESYGLINVPPGSHSAMNDSGLVQGNSVRGVYALTEVAVAVKTVWRPATAHEIPKHLVATFEKSNNVTRKK
jgi:hypothetical protein